ncbi:hypothetical protein [Azospirillum sp. SYSU D00513]|uniref:hypothetical protein n=1 Tax=Azospirillum sp. SYSU D00513 TaxID=2812561 RepID=UPI001FFE723C|nr:hypothetical protein [Azospirillum sp. SYSU D00513]
MQALSFSGAVSRSAKLHLSVLDDFIAVVEQKLTETANPFARDSLCDMLANLREQRDGYLTLAEPAAIAA